MVHPGDIFRGPDQCHQTGKLAHYIIEDFFSAGLPAISFGKPHAFHRQRRRMIP
jgi:hypothetical protein